MRTRMAVLAVAVGTAVALMGPALPAQAQGGSGCELDGSAKFKPALTNDAADFTYSFGGTLSNCMSNEDGAPTDGAVSAGQILTINGQKFQEPVAKGNGSCGNSHTEGVSIVKWSDNSYSVVGYTTGSGAAGVALQGTVVPSVRLKAVRPKPGQPRSATIKTTAYSGAGALGTLVFEPPDPTACGAAGVTEAGIQGFIGYGNYQ